MKIFLFTTAFLFLPSLNNAKACAPHKMKNVSYSSIKQQITDGSNPNLSKITHFTHNKIQEYILLLISYKYNVDLATISFDTSIYDPPLCMIHRQVSELIYELQGLPNILYDEKKFYKSIDTKKKKINLNDIENAFSIKP